MEEIIVSKTSKAAKAEKAPKAAKPAKAAAAAKAPAVAKAKTSATTRAPKKTQETVSELVELTESLVSDDERRDMIAEAAYFLAEQRGFDPSQQVNDWLEAEASVDEMLKKAVKEATY